MGEREHHLSHLRRASLRKDLGVPRVGLRTMPRLTRVVVLPVLRRHWALHARRCPGAAPEKRNALERTYDAFVETAAKQWARLQDAPRHSPKDYARRTIQTILDASRDPDEQFLVELGGGHADARIEVRFPTALDERLVRRRLAKLAAARKNEHLWRSRAWLATAPVLAPLVATPITKWPIVYAFWRWQENACARRGAAFLETAPITFVADPSLDALPNALDAPSAERAVAGAGAVVAHKRRWLRRNGRDLGGNDDDDLAYG